jgi:GAF domain-containing protein
VPAGDPAVQAAVDRLGRVSVAEHSLESLLATVTSLAAGLLPGPPAASVTVLRNGVPLTLAASAPLAQELDEIQYRHGNGPCVEAAATGHLVVVAAPGTDTRWGPVGPVVAGRGVRGLLSHPLPGREAVSGALNLYARGDAGSLTALARFADHAVVPVSNVLLYRGAVQRAEHLAAALDSRAVIDQAKGILMERFKLTADQAFHALARVSMQTNLKAREVAERLVRTGELPGI